MAAIKKELKIYVIKKQSPLSGICKDKCQNGGKCIQKDKCQCSKGYYGLRCEYCEWHSKANPRLIPNPILIPFPLTAKCVIPCKNEGRCIGNNKCRCPNGLRGDHCEIGRKQRSICKCRNGVCLSQKRCKCHPGFYGRHCNGRKCQCLRSCLLFRLHVPAFLYYRQAESCPLRPGVFSRRSSDPSEGAHTIYCNLH